MGCPGGQWGNATVIATGQSGHILSRHYDDLAELWRSGDYISMSMNREDIAAGALGVSMLRPAP